MMFLLIIAAWIFYIGYITIIEQEDKTNQHEDEINKLNNEIKELKEKNDGWTFEKGNRGLDFTFT